MVHPHEELEVMALRSCQALTFRQNLSAGLVTMFKAI